MKKQLVDAKKSAATDKENGKGENHQSREDQASSRRKVHQRHRSAPMVALCSCLRQGTNTNSHRSIVRCRHLSRNIKRVRKSTTISFRSVAGSKAT